MHIVFWLFQIRSVPLNIFPSMSSWPLDLHPNFLQEKTTYDRLPNWHEDRNGVVRMCEFTWAAEGSRALQQPSSDLIYFCTSLWCCTLASMCCPGSGSTSGPHPPSPHSTGFLINEQNTNQATVFKVKRCSLVKGRSCFCWEKVLQENQKHIFLPRHTDPRQWIRARTGEICETVGGVRSWWAASSFYQTAAAGHREPARHRNLWLWTGDDTHAQT